MAAIVAGVVIGGSASREGSAGKYSRIAQPPAAAALAQTLTETVSFNRLSPLSAARLYGYTFHGAMLAWHDTEGPVDEKERNAIEAAVAISDAILEDDGKGGVRARQMLDALRRRYNPDGKPASGGRWRRILEIVEDDPYLTTVTEYAYQAADGPYDWEPTGLTRTSFTEPGWSLMEPLVTASAACTLPAPDHQRAVDEAVALFSEWTGETALYPSVLRWLGGSGSPTPPGQWLVIAADAANSYGLDEGASMRLLGKVAVAGYDASVLIWREKLRHNLARPETLWERQGNEPVRLPRETPPHPSYPSGHSGFSTAAATIIDEVIRGPIVFRLPADMAAPAETNRYSSAAKAASEAGASRVRAGFHIPLDIEAGEDLGRCVGEAVDTALDELVGAP